MEKEELVELQVSGMHCNNCALSVHKLLEKKGLQDIYVDFANDEVKFKTDDPNSDFKINNNYAPYYSRLIIANNPTWEKVFELREIRSN